MSCSAVALRCRRHPTRTSLSSCPTLSWRRRIETSWIACQVSWDKNQRCPQITWKTRKLYIICRVLNGSDAKERETRLSIFLPFTLPPSDETSRSHTFSCRETRYPGRFREGIHPKVSRDSSRHLELSIDTIFVSNLGSETGLEAQSFIFFYFTNLWSYLSRRRQKSKESFLAATAAAAAENSLTSRSCRDGRNPTG